MYKILNFHYYLFLLILVISGFCFMLGVNGPFLLDDFHNLEPIALDGGITNMDLLLKYVLGGKDGFWRSIPKLTFVFNSTTWPSPALYFKITNVVIHLLNAILVYWLVFRCLLNYKNNINWARTCSLIVASLWVLNASQVSTVLYVVQRMAQLALTFSLASLVAATYYFTETGRREKIISISFCLIFAVCATLSKKNSLIIPLALLLIFNYFFVSNPKKISDSLVNSIFLVGSVVIVCAFLYATYRGINSYQFRGYGIFDRLGIQGYVLVQYIKYWCFPWLQGQGLFHDDLELYLKNSGVGWFWLYWGVHLIALGVAFYCRNKCKVVSFGILWFYTWHIIESTILPLELMFEHRNYVAGIGLSIVIGVGLINFASYSTKKGLSVVGIALIFLIFSLQTIYTAKRSAIWGDEYMLLSKWAYEKPRSIRAQTSFVSVLANAGLSELAATKAEDVFEEFNVITGIMNITWVACSRGVKPLTSLVLDKNAVSHSEFVPGLLFHISRYFDLLEKENCLMSTFNGDGVLQIAESIGKISKLHQHKAYYSSYLNLMADQYVKVGDYGNAVKSRERVYQLQPSSDTALLLAKLFISGGNLEEADKYLVFAFRHINEEKLSNKRNLENYRQLRRLLDHANEEAQ